MNELPLKPCPFCGSNDIRNYEGLLSVFHVVCTNCGAQGPSCSTNDSKEFWNIRHEANKPADEPRGAQ